MQCDEKKGNGSIEFRNGFFYWVIRSGSTRHRIRLGAMDRPGAEEEVRRYGSPSEVMRSDYPSFLRISEEITRQNTRRKLSDVWKYYVNHPRCPDCNVKYLEQKENVWSRFVAYALERGCKFLDELNEEILFSWLEEYL